MQSKWWMFGLVGFAPDQMIRWFIRREAVEVCLKEVMEGEKGKEIRKNAVKWTKLAREAIDEGRSSDKYIGEFVAKLSATTKTMQ